MSRIDELPADRRAVLELLVKRGKSYDELAALLRIDPATVRERAHDAVRRLGQVDDQDELADFVLGQQTPQAAATTRARLHHSGAARDWARLVTGELRVLARDGELLNPAAESPPLAERPLLTTPHLHHHHFRAHRRRLLERQPHVALAGLIVVAVACLLLGLGAGGAQSSLLVLGPITTYSLPVIAMIALWWEDWPGSSLRGGWAGLADSLIIVVGALLLTMLGQSIAGHLDFPGIFETDPGPGHLATYPAALPLAALAFTCMIHVTLVMEGWPLRQLGRFWSGISALGVSWAVAVVAYLVLIGTDDLGTPAELHRMGLHNPGGPLHGDALGAWLVCVAAYQAFFFIGLNGWPFSHYESRAKRLLTGNVAVIGGGWLTYLICHDLFDWSFSHITAIGGCLIAATVLSALLFDGWPAAHMSPSQGRWVTFGVIVAATAILKVVLSAFADGVQSWTAAGSDDWITFAGLNFIAGSAIIHVAIWRRWPLPDTMMEGGH